MYEVSSPQGMALEIHKTLHLALHIDPIRAPGRGRCPILVYMQVRFRRVGETGDSKTLFLHDNKLSGARSPRSQRLSAI